MRSKALVVLVVSSAFSLAFSATCLMKIGTVLTPPGQAVEVPVTLSTDFDVEAFSFAVAHDPAKLEVFDITGLPSDPLNFVIEGITPGAAIPLIAANPDVQFWQVKLYQQAGGFACGSEQLNGMSLACLYQKIPGGLPLPGNGTEHELVRVKYTPLVASGTCPLRFRACFGTPPVALRVIYDDGATYGYCGWNEGAGAVHVAAAELSLSAPAGPIDQGESFDATVALETQGDTGAGGCSFAVTYDAAILTLNSVVGLPPAGFLNFVLTPTIQTWTCDSTTFHGATAVCVVDNPSWTTQLPPNSATNVAKLTFTARNTGFPASTAISFAACPPAGFTQKVQFDDPDSYVVPATSGASVTIAGVPFIRGDVSQDGSIDIGDAVVTLNYLFSGKPITCEESADINGDKKADIGDAIRLLGYLFQGSSEPPPPFPACGIPAQYQFGCVDSACP